MARLRSAASAGENFQLVEDVFPNSDNVSSDSEQIRLNFARYIAVNLMRRKFDTDVTVTFNVSPTLVKTFPNKLLMRIFVPLSRTFTRQRNTDDTYLYRHSPRTEKERI